MFVRRDDGAGRLRGGGLRHPQLGHDHQLAVVQRLGRTDGVGIGAEIERTHERGDLRRGLVPADGAGRGGAVLAAEILLHAFGLRAALQRAVGEALHQLFEAFHAGFEALGVERERGLAFGQVKAALHQDVTLVDGARHPVPGDAVAAFAVEHGPHGRVEAGVFGQRTVVEVDRRARGHRDHLGRQHREVGDREEVVEGADVLRGEQRGRVGQHADALLGSPSADRGARRDHGHDLVACLLENLPALDQQGLRTDEDATH